MNPTSSNVLARLRSGPLEPLPEPRPEPEPEPRPEPEAQGIIYDESANGYIIGKFGITAHGLYIAEGTSEQEWVDFRRSVETLEKAGDWTRADWCRYGIDVLGQTPQQTAIVAGNMSAETAESYASISRQASEMIRIISPSVSHFRLVMALPEDDQATWLRRAASGEWSVSRLRAELNTAAGVIKLRRPNKADLRAAVKAQKTEYKALFVRSRKLPASERSQLANYLRELALELESK